jgi:hypothetical protein
VRWLDVGVQPAADVLGVALGAARTLVGAASRTPA